MDETFFVDYLERLDNLYNGFRKEMDGLPAEALDWVPGPEMNSIAVLVAHTTGSLRYWIGEAALGEPVNRDREREFQTKGVSAAELLQRLDVFLAYVRIALPKMDWKELAEESSAQQNGKPVTRGWALLHALEHGYLHLGHVQLTAQLWRGRG